MPKILCVNNNENVRELLKIILARAGYECIGAMTSKKALVILQAQAIDLIIQNIRRPDLDGCEFHARLQQNRRFAAIPMLIITPLHPFDLPATCQPLIEAYYPRDFVSMPFCPQTIITKVQAALQSPHKPAPNASPPPSGAGLQFKMAGL